MKWEYAVVEINFDGKHIWISDNKEKGNLDEDMGFQGWELVSVVPFKNKMLGFFKRQHQKSIHSKRPIVFIDNSPLKDPKRRWVERILGHG